ncbi:MAG: efflux RND transporter permease subunit [Sedimenticola sp.]
MTTAIRHKIETGFERFGHLVYHNHWKVLLLAALFIAGLVSQLPKLTMDTSTEGFLHDDDPTLLQYNEFREQFGRDELVIIAIESEAVFDLTFLKKLKALHGQLESDLPYLDDITSLINARNTRGAEGQLIVEELLENWPENETALQEIRERAMDNPLYRNMLLSEDGTITTIIIKTDAYSGGNDEGDVMAGFDDETDLETVATTDERPFLSDAENSELVNTARSITDQYRADDFRIHLAGTPVVADVLKRSMQSNMKRFMLIAIVTIAFILALLFRRISGVLMPLLVVITSLLSTLGLMGLTGTAFKLPTQILPSFLLAVGVGASVHLLSIFYRNLQLGDSREEAIAHALGHSGLAIVMTSLTTAAGLASFSGAEVAPISDLGKIAASGIIIALIYTLVLIPALLSIFPIKAKVSESAHKRHALMDSIMEGIASFSVQRSRLVLTISLGLLIISLAGVAQIRFSHKPFTWLPETEPVRIGTDFIDSRLNGASSLEVIVDTGRENGLYEPQIMKGLEQLNRDVDRIDEGELFVGKTLSVADILKEINQALNENRADFYTIPDDRQLIAQEFLLFENSGSDDLEDFVDSRFQLARFTARMPWVDGILYNDFMSDIKNRFQTVLGEDVGITVTGMAALLGRTMHATMISTAESYLIAVAIITLMMVLLIGDIRIGLVAMIPNLTPIILTLGLMGWIGLPLDLFTMLIGSIAIGLAVDDTIHFMHNYRRYHQETNDVHEAVRQTLLTTGRALLVTSIVLSCGFFLYMFANMSNIRSFGLLTGFAILMALAADFFLAPALMKELHKTHLIPDDSDY